MEEEETKKFLTVIAVIVTIVLVVIIVVTISKHSGSSSNKSSEHSSNSYTSTSDSYSYEVTQNDIETKAMSWVWSEINSNSYKYGSYDVSKTKYNIGSTNLKDTSSSYNDDKYYEVCGTLSFYDKYGSYAESGKFEVTVVVRDDKTVEPKEGHIFLDY